MKSVFTQDTTFKEVRRKIIKNCAERMMVRKQQEQQQEELTAEEKELCGII